MKIIAWQGLTHAEQKAILTRGHSYAQRDQLSKEVSVIIQKVRADKDIALKQYTKAFDNIQLETLALTASAWGAIDSLDVVIKEAINFAYEKIQRFHQRCVPLSIRVAQDGIDLWKEYRAIENVGLYIPGGTAPLVSTLLMLAIPATLAGCKNIIVTTPPNRQGQVHPAILYAAKRCGVDQIFLAGGAQAIAALAYGTESIPKVSKIFGPGNKYVTEAKQQVAQDPDGAALDMPAGPSEVLVIADEMANASFVASDLLAQAEHDEDARAILVTTSEAFAHQVIAEVTEQAKNLSRQTILTKSLPKGWAIVARDLQEALMISNHYAPEHLILQIQQPKKYLAQIHNAGSVFIGPWSAEALGDYASGSNHVLPTYGYAKSYSGISVDAFMKAISFQEVSEQGLLDLCKPVETLTTLEGLDAHKMSVSKRVASLTGRK